LRALAAQDVQNMFLGYFLADRLRAAQQWDEAEVQFRKLLKLEVTADAYQGLATILLHQRRLEPLLHELADVIGQTGSLAALQTAIKLLWEDRELLEQLTTLAGSDDAGRDPELAAHMRMAMALLWARAGDGARAEELFRQAVAQPTRVTGSFAVNLGFQLLEERDAARAAMVLETAVREKWLPDRVAELHFALAGAWARAKDYDRALAAAREAAKLEPNAPRMLAREPWVLYQARRFDEALAGYQALLTQFDGQYDSDPNRDALREMRFVLSAIHVEQQQLAEAEEYLQQILDEYPEDIGAFNDLGYLWSDQGKHLERALRMLQRAVQAEPDNVAYRDSLGWVLYRLGRFPEAVAELKLATAAEPVDGVILDHLGDVYLQMNELPQARDAWQRAADAFATQDDAQRLADVHKKLTQHAAPPADEDQHAPDSGS
jgi:tetratricopeptide (TPR) repeat protein